MSPAVGIIQRQYCLIVTMHAVKLDAAGSELGSIVTIPPGSILQVLGSSALHGMLEAEWDGVLHAVFEEELVRRGQIIGAKSVRAALPARGALSLRPQGE